MEPDQEITLWLTSLNLRQYASSFARAGYRCFKDLRSLTEEKLLEMDNIPTGHRRRILSSLETLVMEVDGCKVPVRRKPIPRPRQVFPKAKQRGTSGQHSQGSNIQMTRQTLPSRTIADSERMPLVLLHFLIHFLLLHVILFPPALAPPLSMAAANHWRTFQKNLFQMRMMTFPQKELL